MRIDGLHWHVWRARGPLYRRQVDANLVGCIAAVEQHLNASTDKTVNYASALITSEKSRAWAKDYVARAAREFSIRDAGVVMNPPRGSFCLKFYACPAILVEPGFVSHHDFANRVQSGEGIDALARVLVDSVCAMFPDGGLVALSVGHGYRGTPDPGALVNDAGDVLDPAFDSEEELNDAIVTAAEEMLLLRRLHDAPTDPSELGRPEEDAPETPRLT
jgi:hypothetical protein